MAVTNQLLIYAAETSNKMDDATYLAASQRISGVQANQVISSSLHNTVMRSSTLILKALVDSLITNSTLSEGSISTNSEESDVKSLFDSLFSGFKANKDSNGDIIAQTYAVDIKKDVDTSGVITLQLLAKTAHGSPSTKLIGNPITIQDVVHATTADEATTAINATNTSFTNNEYIERSVDTNGYFSMYDSDILHVFYLNAQLSGHPSKLINFGVMNSMRVQDSYSGYYTMQASAIDDEGNIYVISDRSASGYTLQKKAPGATSFTPVSGGYIYFKVLK